MPAGCHGPTFPFTNIVMCEHLDSLLQNAPDARRRLIVTDSLFSMDGDFAPLVEIAALRERYGCMLLVDEAHATGVFGPNGRGISELLGVESSVDIKVGTLSKALGCAGGFVGGPATVIQWLINSARSYIFSTSHPAATAAAADAALQIIQKEPFRRNDLLAKAAWMREKLKSQGWDLGSFRESDHSDTDRIGQAGNSRLQQR